MTSSERARGGDALPVESDPDEMRRLGHAVVDRIVERWARLRDAPTGGPATRDDMEARLGEPAPETGVAIDAILDRFWSDVEPFAGRIDHPRFFAFIPSSPTFASMLGGWLVTGCNFFQGTWIESAGPSQVELTVIDWLREWLELPRGAGGLFTSGGSAANLLGLAAARQAHLDGVPGDGTVYCSSETHTAVDRALRVLGFPADRLRRLPVTSGGTLDPIAVARAVETDRRSGLQPFCIVANAGTTNRGAVDPLDALADLCRNERLWLHVDGAYGAIARITERGRARLGGLARMDSLVLDPHKWLYVGYEAGCLLVRDPRILLRTFAMRPDYLQDTETGDGEVNFADYGIQLTREARAVKVWFSLLAHGRRGIAALIERTLELAEYAEERVRETPGLAVAAPASLGILCFRYAGDDTASLANPVDAREATLDRINESAVKDLQEAGRLMLSSTRIDGRYVIRLCPMNYRTSEGDIDEALSEVVRAARAAAGRESALP